MTFVFVGNSGSQTAPPPPRPPSSSNKNDSFNQELQAIESEEKEFNKQYTDWLQQYKDWKDQNKSKEQNVKYKKKAHSSHLIVNVFFIKFYHKRLYKINP